MGKALQMLFESYTAGFKPNNPNSLILRKMSQELCSHVCADVDEDADFFAAGPLQIHVPYACKQCSFGPQMVEAGGPLRCSQDFNSTRVSVCLYR